MWRLTEALKNVRVTGAPLIVSSVFNFALYEDPGVREASFLARLSQPLDSLRSSWAKCSSRALSRNSISSLMKNKQARHKPFSAVPAGTSLACLPDPAPGTSLLAGSQRRPAYRAIFIRR